MSKKNSLHDPEIDDSLKAFVVSLSRYIAEDPRLLLLLDQARPINSGNYSWKALYDDLQDNTAREHLVRNMNTAALDYDWSNIEHAYTEWGRFGWIADSTLTEFGFWANCPCSQIAADKLILAQITKPDFIDLQENAQKRTHDLRLFNEACTCFDNKCYAACASLLIALIDGELIRSRANATVGNKKTGSKASNRIVAEVSKDKHYGLPGHFHLELLNFESFIHTLFEPAGGFENEPKRINRNYLHHGMSKRKVLRKDCIKLFVAYRRTLYFAEYYSSQI